MYLMEDWKACSRRRFHEERRRNKERTAISPQRSLHAEEIEIFPASKYSAMIQLARLLNGVHHGFYRRAKPREGSWRSEKEEERLPTFIYLNTSFRNFPVADPLEFSNWNEKNRVTGNWKLMSRDWKLPARVKINKCFHFVQLSSNLSEIYKIFSWA